MQQIVLISCITPARLFLTQEAMRKVVKGVGGFDHAQVCYRVKGC